MLGAHLEIVGGGEKVIRRLQHLGEKLADFRPLAAMIDPIFYGWMGERMDSEGRGSWEPLSPSYAAAKAARYPGKPILQASGAMYDGLTADRSKYSVHRITVDSGEWGTDAPYARYHQDGTGRMPQREIILVDTDLRVGILEAMRVHMRDTLAAR